jgi:arylsulfatase/uncharacterized sulfatase
MANRSLPHALPWFRRAVLAAVLGWATVPGLAMQGTAAAEPAAAPRPNIVLVVIDDATPTDLGAYGSEIATPNIDRLAAAGTRFTNFRATPMCAPSRAMLLTGVDSHTAGIGNLPESVPGSHAGQRGYLGHLADDVVTVATLLQRGGYRTYAAGKWHLGHTPGTLPNARGFERSFVVDATGADNWEQRPYLPIYDGSEWYEDGKPAALPADFYSSRFLVDRMIEYIGDGKGDARPFLAYLPFLAIHIPVQAPQAVTDRYVATYAAGWDAQRQRRHAAAIAAGLVPATAATRPVPMQLRDWEALDAETQARQARAMAVNAAMMETMDHEFGRLVAHLRRIGAFEDTLFVILADNGPEPGDPAAAPLFRAWLRMVGYDTSLERLGTKGSFVAIGPEAAKANTAPFALFKFNAAEGGLRVPLVVAGPGVRGGARADANAFITDITPTLLELTGIAPAPAPAPAIVGRSLAPLLRGDATQVHPADASVAIEAAGSAAVYRGNLKLVRDRPPFGDERWHLYDLAADPGETNDLAQARPADVQSMLADYARYAERVGVLEVPPGYDTTREVGARIVRVFRERYGHWIVTALAVLLGLAGWGAWRLVRRRRMQAT